MNFDQFLLKKYKKVETIFCFSGWQKILSPDDWKNLADEFADECVKKAK